MSAPPLSPLSPPHPILGCLEQMRTTLAEVSDVQPVFMTTTDKQTALVELARLEAQLTELRLRVLAASNEVGEQSGARDAAAWLSHTTRTDPAPARADSRLATALERWTTVATGMRTGAVSTAQARVITTALADLPTGLAPQLLTDAETTLVDHCDTFRPTELRRLARHLLEVIAPDIAEEEEARRLQAQEHRAHATATMRFHDRGDGTTLLRALLPTSVTTRLQRYLHAYTSPRAHGSGTTSNGERVPQHRAHAHAFNALLEALDPDRLPRHGGDATTLVITMSLDQLRTDLATANVLTDTDDDLTIPATWCEIHHRQPWARGGHTNLTDGIAFCSHHHHLAHNPTYDDEWLPDGRVRFHRRP